MAHLFRSEHLTALPCGMGGDCITNCAWRRTILAGAARAHSDGRMQLFLGEVPERSNFRAGRHQSGRGLRLFQPNAQRLGTGNRADRG